MTSLENRSRWIVVIDDDTDPGEEIKRISAALEAGEIPAKIVEVGLHNPIVAPLPRGAWWTVVVALISFALIAFAIWQEASALAYVAILVVVMLVLGAHQYIPNVFGFLKKG